MFSLRFRLVVTVLMGVLLAQGMPVAAAAMRDEVFQVEKSHTLFTVQLSVRLFAPLGPGPFPLIVINHGKAPGKAFMQQDRAFYFQAREFVKRGYAVLVPTREGFGSSGGHFQEQACNAAHTGELQADDIELSINYAKTLPYVDGSRIVVIGQSVGGLATMALGERNLPGVLGLIDMAGGIRYDSCAGWRQGDIDAFAQYGAQSRAPALMIYGDNDTYWGPGPEMPKALSTAYRQAGGRATFVDVGVFKQDSHNTFSDPDGMALWAPAVKDFLAALNLPFDERYSLRNPQPDGVDVEDIDAVPTSSRACKQLYANHFLGADPKTHRAFALSDDGHCGYATGEDSAQRALGFCAQHGAQGCALYAQDEKVVSSQAQSGAN
ncbi:MAG: prolyl oligopeptidase family serine peptidase [Paludibacterium sp.]|uniref:dienelactone hydrolase family protein n=1 Tax=Paludibacterium sp. TaxID=1917523 RepID=UPI0025DF4FC1|nr:prolyl oligopeptidase family serine peptidase [Paludibacterium sp.]MBV8047762.1 prolyl oligopeptidase family serine peptidase [Paludibacterium sp.]MBV8648754.1 prolyl oligopeptidase family serine peptidase [Paludibacterium sp.]